MYMQYTVNNIQKYSHKNGYKKISIHSRCILSSTLLAICICVQFVYSSVKSSLLHIAVNSTNRSMISLANYNSEKSNKCLMQRQIQQFPI